MHPDHSAGLTDMTAGQPIFPNAERHLKSPVEMRRLFAGFPEAVSRTLEIAGRCRFSLDELRYEYPEALCPPDREVHVWDLDIIRSRLRALGLDWRP